MPPLCLLTVKHDSYNGLLDPYGHATLRTSPLPPGGTRMFETRKLVLQGSIFSALALAGTLASSGCTGDKGDTGPAGPAGPAGGSGTNGDTGSQGATGGTGPQGGTG